MTTGAEELPLPNGVGAQLAAAKELLARSDREADDTVFAQGRATSLLASSWPGGAAAAAAQQEATTLGTKIGTISQRLVDAGSALLPVETALTTATTRITQLQVDWDEAEAEYHRALHDINYGHDTRALPLDEKQGLADAKADERDAKLDALRKSYKTERENLRTVANAAAKTLASLEAQTAIRDRQCFGDPAHVEGTDVASQVLGDLPIASGALHQEVAERESEYYKGELDAVLGKERVFDIDTDRLGTLYEQLNGKMSDPYFASSFMRREGPAGIESALGKLRLLDTFGEQTHSPGTHVYEQWGTVFATGFNVASGGKDDTLDEFSRSRLSEWRKSPGGWFSQLRDYGRSHRTVHMGEGTASISETAEFEGYWMVGELMAAGKAHGVGPGSEFLREVGTDLLARDRERMQDPSAHDDFRLHPRLRAENTTSPDLLHLSGPGYDRTADPVWSLLYAAEGDDAGTQAMLMAPTGKGSQQTNLSWLMKDRLSGFDHDAQLAGLGPFSDHGDQLGRTVLAAATGEPMSQTYTNPAYSQLSSEYVNSYGEMLRDAAPDKAARLGGLRGSVADIMLRYPRDLADAVTHPDHGTNSYVPGVAKEFGLVVKEPHDLARIFGELGRDHPEQLLTAGSPPNALNRVLASVNTYAAADALQAYTADGQFAPGRQGEPKWEESAADRASRGATLLSYITAAAAEANDDVALGLDKSTQSRKEAASNLIDLASAGAAVPVPALGMAGPAVKLSPLLSMMYPDGHIDTAQHEGSKLQLVTSDAWATSYRNVVIQAEPWNHDPDADMYSFRKYAQMRAHAEPRADFSVDDLYDANGKLHPPGPQDARAPYFLDWLENADYGGHYVKAGGIGPAAADGAHRAHNDYGSHRGK